MERTRKTKKMFSCWGLASTSRFVVVYLLYVNVRKCGPSVLYGTVTVSFWIFTFSTWTSLPIVWPLRLYYYQMTEEECNTCPSYVPLTHFEMVMWFRIEPNKKDRGPVVRRPISANPGLDFNLVSFSFLLKAFCRIIFSILFNVSNHQTVDEKNSTEYAF